MSFGMHSDAAGEYVGTAVGNSAQSIVVGLWLAAYAVDGRPESNRVCAWVNSGRRPGWRAHPMAPRTERNQPRSVEALIAFTYDEDGGRDGEQAFTAVTPVDETIRLGIKMKPVTDPVLADLVALYLAMCDPAHYSGTLAADLVARLATTMEELLPRLEAAGGWYKKSVQVARVFRAAADAGASVSFG